MKLASRRVERAKNRATQAPSTVGIMGMLMRPVRALWAWLRCVDLIAMVNLTLLVAIIVLFSMLIIDMTRPTPTPVVVVNPDMTEISVTRPQITVTNASAPQHVRDRDVRNAPVVAASVPESEVTVVHAAPVAEPESQKYDLYGDVVIDARYDRHVLATGMRVAGNVYLQNMRRYTLPCGTYINGDLFLRDVAQLRFCGDFVVTGNIYVNRNSSFGPIPCTARLGGQVIM